MFNDVFLPDLPPERLSPLLPLLLPILPNPTLCGDDNDDKDVAGVQKEEVVVPTGAKADPVAMKSDRATVMKLDAIFLMVIAGVT